jgi:hypothetical protein
MRRRMWYWSKESRTWVENTTQVPLNWYKHLGYAVCFEKSFEERLQIAIKKSRNQRSRKVGIFS